MLLTLSKNLAPLRAEAIAKVDRSAEDMRGRFITLGPGQSMVYQQKRVEAERVTADPAVNPATVPHIAREAALNGISLLDQAAIILSMSHNWAEISSTIEERRLGAKEAIRAATSPAMIAEASNIDWSDIQALSS